VERKAEVACEAFPVYEKEEKCETQPSLKEIDLNVLFK
jgi:hypothetical protein